MMITNDIADAVIAKAIFEKQKDDARPAQFACGEPLGNYVQLVFMSVAPDHVLPYSAALATCNDRRECRNVLLRSAY